MCLKSGDYVEICYRGGVSVLFCRDRRLRSTVIRRNPTDELETLEIKVLTF